MSHRFLAAGAVVLLLAACQAASTSTAPVKRSGQGLNRQAPDYYGRAAYDCRQDGFEAGNQAYDDCVWVRSLERMGTHR